MLSLRSLRKGQSPIPALMVSLHNGTIHLFDSNGDFMSELHLNNAWAQRIDAISNYQGEGKYLTTRRYFSFILYK